MRSRLESAQPCQVSAKRLTSVVSELSYAVESELAQPD
jgi:hypothetical protein